MAEKQDNLNRMLKSAGLSWEQAKSMSIDELYDILFKDVRFTGNTDIKNSYLKSLLLTSCYKPSEHIMAYAREHIPISGEQMREEIRMLFSLCDFKRLDVSCDDREKIDELLLDLEMLVLKSAEKYVKREKDNFSITYHAAWRFLKRYSHEYDLNSFLKEIDDNEIKTHAMANFSCIVENVMYDYFIDAARKGKDPYKFRKISVEFATHLEHLKHKNGKDVKLKVYAGSIWIFKKAKDAMILITMYEVPKKYRKFIREEEFIDSFYDILADRDLLDVSIPVMALRDENGNIIRASSIIFPRNEQIERQKRVQVN